jgi:F420-non-reducing hydrogenase iron-sulfur subunit
MLAMEKSTATSRPTILILAALSGGYAGADAVGQLHVDYPSNTYIFPVRTPAIFPAEFYLHTFERGVDGIIVMYSGVDCPYKGAPERTAQIINHTYDLMKECGIDTRRLRLAAICTVCTKPFLKETNQMNDLLRGIGYVKDEIATHAAKEVQAGQHARKELTP